MSVWKGRFSAFVTYGAGALWLRPGDTIRALLIVSWISVGRLNRLTPTEKFLNALLRVSAVGIQAVRGMPVDSRVPYFGVPGAKLAFNV